MDGRRYELFMTRAGAECFCEVMNDTGAQAKARELPDGRGTSIWIVWYNQ